MYFLGVHGCTLRNEEAASELETSLVCAVPANPPQKPSSLLSTRSITGKALSECGVTLFDYSSELGVSCLSCNEQQLRCLCTARLVGCSSSRVTGSTAGFLIQSLQGTLTTAACTCFATSESEKHTLIQEPDRLSVGKCQKSPSSACVPPHP